MEKVDGARCDGNSHGLNGVPAPSTFAIALWAVPGTLTMAAANVKIQLKVGIANQRHPFTRHDSSQHSSMKEIGISNGNRNSKVV